MSQTPASGEAVGEDDSERSGELPPGPDGLPVLGSTLSFLRDPYAFYEELATHGDVVRYQVGPWTFCTFLAPEYVEQALVGEPERFRKWNRDDVGVEFAPEGLLQTDGEQWAKQRRLLQPAFRPDRIAGYADAMAEYAGTHAEGWDDGQRVDLTTSLSKLTLRILADSLFDVDVRDHDDVVTEFANALNARANADSPTAFLPEWVPTPSNRRYRRARRDLRAFIDETVAERRAGATGDDLLGLLLTAETDEGETLSEREVRDQLVTFLFAGHETSSLALTYTLLCLATHPEYAERLRAEYDRVLDGAAPTLADLGNLEETERVLQESLRRYPPAYVLFREAAEDVRVGDSLVPEGTKITLPQFRLHTDERFWDDPETFDPDRWRRDRDRPEYAYFPFGGGPRHCIGMRFARMELKTVLPVLLQSAEFELLSDPDPEMSIGATLQPTEPVEVRVRKR